MKIKWIGGERQLPSLGIMRYGDIREADDQLAKDLIRQKQAVEYHETETKKTNKKNIKER